MSPYVVDLEECHLLGEEQLAALRAERDANGGALDARDEVARLVARGWLTAWQGEMLLAGQKGFYLGKYKLLDQVGRGGMGTVFKAEHVNLRRIVALKVMAERLLSKPESVARFHREIQAAAALNHPHIVMAYDADCVGSTHFLVTEYVEGQTLDRLLRDGRRLGVAQACEYIRQAALGLAHAHERGMVHRDIKPSNLMIAMPVSKEGIAGAPVVKILDMGLARLTGVAQGDGELTQSGQIMGTPDYIAPEQARNTREADIRSDIFSLGCTLFRALTGQVPYPGTSIMEKLLARGLEDAPRIGTLCPEISPALEAVVARMLARNPGDRYQTPIEVARALEPFAAGAAHALEPSPAPPAEGPASPADPEMAGFLEQLATEAAVDDSISAETLGGQSAAATHGALEPGRHPTQQRSARGRPRALRHHEAQVRGIGWKIWVLGSLGAIVCMAIIVWSQAGQTALVVEWSAGAGEHVELLIDGRVRRLPAGSDSSARFPGPAGRRTLRATREGYQPINGEWTLARGEEARIDLEWKPTVATRRSDELADMQRRVAATATGKPADRAEIETLRGRLDAFRRRHFGTPEGIAAAESLARLPALFDVFHHDAVAKDERRVVAPGMEGAAPRELVAVIGSARWRHPQEIRDFALSPDGRFAVSSAEDQRVRIWDTATGYQLHQPAVRSAVHTPVAMGGTPALAAAGIDDRSIRVWNAETGEQVARLADPAEAAEWHPAVMRMTRDGALLACGCADGSVRVWEVSSQRMVHHLKGHHGPVVALAFDEARNRLYSGSDPAARGFVPTTLVEDGGKPPAPGEATLVTWALDTGERVDESIADSVTGLALDPGGGRLAVLTSRHMVLQDLVRGREVARVPQSDLRFTDFDPERNALYASNYRIVTWDLDSNHVSEEPRLQPRPNVLRMVPGSRTLAVACQYDICLWELGEQRERPGREPFIQSLALHPDGRRLATGHSDGSVWLRDMAGEQEVRRLQSPGIHVFALTFSNDGKWLAGSVQHATGHSRLLRVWNVDSGGEHLDLTGDYLVMCMSFSRDDRSLIVGTFLGQLLFYDVATGEQRALVDASMGPNDRREVFSLAVSPDGKNLATGSWIFDKALRLWDLGTRRETFVLRGHTGNVRSVAWSPDGRSVISGSSDTTTRLWDAASGKSKSVLHYDERGVTSVAVDAQNRRVAVGGQGGRLAVVSLPAGDPLYDRDFSASCGILQVEFTPDGRHLLTRNGNGTAYVVRLAGLPASAPKP